MKNIMDYRAYSGNIYYNQTFRPDNPLDHSANYEFYKGKLPAGWWKIR